MGRVKHYFSSEHKLISLDTHSQSSLRCLNSRVYACMCVCLFVSSRLNCAYLRVWVVLFLFGFQRSKGGSCAAPAVPLGAKRTYSSTPTRVVHTRSSLSKHCSASIPDRECLDARFICQCTICPRVLWIDPRIHSTDFEHDHVAPIAMGGRISLPASGASFLFWISTRGTSSGTTSVRCHARKGSARFSASYSPG